MLWNSRRLLEFGAVASLGHLLVLPKAFAQIECGDLVDAAAASAPSGCVQVADVTLSDTSPINGVNLRNIQSVGGDLDLRGASLESFEASSLVNITGDFTIKSSKLSRLEIPKLSSLGGDLSFEFSDSPLMNVGLNLSRLAIDSDFAFTQSPNIQRISLSLSPSAMEGNRSLAIDSLYSLGVLDIEGVEFTTINITATSLSSIPNIWSPTANDIKLYSLGLLGNLSVASTAVGSSIALAGIGSPSVTFPELTTIGGDFNLIQTDTVELSFPQLRSVSGGFTLSQNDRLQSISVEAVESISNLAFANNSLLADVSFPALGTLDILTIQFNDHLTALDLQTWFPKLSQVSQYIILQGQFDSVTFPNLQNGIGIKAPLITIVSSVELDCDAVRTEATAKQAIRDPAKLECTSGPKGSKPSATGSSTSSANPSSTPTDGSNGGEGSGAGKSSTNIGAIVGGTIGGIVVIIAIMVTAWIYVRRRKPQNRVELPTSNKLGGIEEHMGGIDDASRGAGGISSK